MARYNLGDIIIHKIWKSLYIVTERDENHKRYIVAPISDHSENRKFLWEDKYRDGIPVTYEEGIIYFELGA